MIKNKKKIKVLLLMLLIVNTINTMIVEASSWGGGYNVPADNGNSACNSPPGRDHDCGGGLTATCWALEETKDWSYVTVHGYDINGNEIDDVLNINTNILAGTYIGLNVYENKGYEIKVTTGACGYQEYQKCKKEIPAKSCSQAELQDGTCTPRDKSWQYRDEKGLSCPGGWTKYGSYYKVATACPTAYTVCKNKGKPSPKPLYPSYEALYENSNDIDDDSELNSKYNTEEIVSGSLTNQTYRNSSGSNSWHLYDEKTFYYNREKVCINVKNGYVRYVKKDEICEDEEYEVTSKDGYWPYFVPLNANSANDFKFYLNPAKTNSEIDPEICANIIDNHSNYTDLIRPLSGDFSNNKNSDRRLVERVGCQYSTTITIPIKQRFYNELENGINFKGFNFYYRPIDINNPFPNGLTNTSIWYNWNSNSNKEPDISESYNFKNGEKNITYIADVAKNTNDIRNYKKNCGEQSCEYTSWYNMNIDGSSNFIKDKDYIIRKVENNSYYPLGCGPLNENQTNEDRSANIFFQPECGKS